MQEKFLAPAIETISGDFKPDEDLSFGAYKQDGEIYIFVDSLNPEKLTSFGTKQLAYEYRLGIGMAYSGIGQSGGPFTVGPNDFESKLKPVKVAKSKKTKNKEATDSTVEEETVKPVWRQLYKLTPML